MRFLVKSQMIYFTHLTYTQFWEVKSLQYERVAYSSWTDSQYYCIILPFKKQITL